MCRCALVGSVKGSCHTSLALIVHAWYPHTNTRLQAKHVSLQRVSDSSLPLRFNSSELMDCRAAACAAGVSILLCKCTTGMSCRPQLMHFPAHAGESMHTTSADTMQRWSSHEGLGPRLSSHFSADVRNTACMDPHSPSSRQPFRCLHHPIASGQQKRQMRAVTAAEHAALCCRPSWGGCPARRPGCWAGGCRARRLPPAARAAASAWTAAAWAGHGTPGVGLECKL
jgi:hypothetical protein